MSGESVCLHGESVSGESVCLHGESMCLHCQPVCLVSECVVSTRVGGLVCLVSQCVGMMSTVSAL